MALISVDLPPPLAAALDKEAKRAGRDPASLVRLAVAQYLGDTVHTLFQVSTSGALVAGVYEREVSVGDVLRHGDFGLGTFVGLDGEMIILDGHAYQAKGSGEVVEAGKEAGAPFAVVTRFAPELSGVARSVSNIREFGAACDAYRESDNIFYAVKAVGRFERVRFRAVNPPPPGARLIDAAKAQSEFTLADVPGTLVGIWSPGYSSAFSVPGYHLHFLSDDRRHGGHLLDLAANELTIEFQTLTDFHLALPETASFLKADLTRNKADELAQAEEGH